MLEITTFLVCKHYSLSSHKNRYFHAENCHLKPPNSSYGLAYYLANCTFILDIDVKKESSPLTKI